MAPCRDPPPDRPGYPPPPEDHGKFVCWMLLEPAPGERDPDQAHHLDHDSAEPAKTGTGKSAKPSIDWTNFTFQYGFHPPAPKPAGAADALAPGDGTPGEQGKADGGADNQPGAEGMLGGGEDGIAAEAGAGSEQGGGEGKEEGEGGRVVTRSRRWVVLCAHTVLYAPAHCRVLWALVCLLSRDIKPGCGIVPDC